MNARNAFIVLFATAVLATFAMSPQSASAQATIIINNIDGPGEGFNDPTPVAPVAGNPGVTLGAQRLNAFTYAANLIGQCLNSGVTIVVDAKMDPQFCDATSAVLGSAGTNFIHRDFAGAPQAATWYSDALADALHGADLNPGNADIGATFNSSLNGDPGCLGGIGWYYGFDQSPGGNIDFVSVVLHEICHGLGFQTFVNSAGQKFFGFNDTYMLNLEHHFAVPADYPSMTDAQRAAGNIGDPNLHWVGACVNADAVLSAGVSNGHVRMHGPNPYQGGSSVSHWSTALSPNELMEPFYTGANHDVGLALSLFKDIGWTLANKSPVAVAITAFEARTSGAGVEIRASFSSPSSSVDVNVYRANGVGNDFERFARLETLTANGAGEFVYYDDTVEPGRTYTYRIGVTDRDGEFLSTADRVDIPALGAELAQNVPNPFNPTTTIGFTLAEGSAVKLMVYDASGRLVRTLVDGQRGAGPHNITWDGRDAAGVSVSSGIYFYRIEAGSFVQSRKMVMLK